MLKLRGQLDAIAQVRISSDQTFCQVSSVSWVAGWGGRISSCAASWMRSHRCGNEWLPVMNGCPSGVFIAGASGRF